MCVRVCVRALVSMRVHERELWTPGRRPSLRELPFPGDMLNLPFIWKLTTAIGLLFCSSPSPSISLPFLELCPSLARRITPMPESFDFPALSRIPPALWGRKSSWLFFFYPGLFRNNRVRSYLCPHMHIAVRPQTAPRTIREASQEVISYKTGENIRSLTFGPCFLYFCMGR